MLADEAQYYTLCYKKMGLIGVDTFEAKELPVFNDILKTAIRGPGKRK